MEVKEKAISKVENIFVFVVCGDNEHITTLNYSLNSLKQFTDNKIIVVTDTSRNSLEIVHDNIVDIITPKEYDHHQASIFLKTSLHKILPVGNNYCYMDSDVITLSNECDQVFDQFIPPIRFAPDHCKLPAFSPSAIYCGCYEKNQREKKELRELLMKFDLSEKLSGYQKFHHNELLKIIYKIRSKPFRNISKILGFLFSCNKFQLNETYYFLRKSRTWHLTTTDEPILFDFRLIIKDVESHSSFRWSRYKIAWINADNENIFNPTCQHLADKIKEKFDIKVGKKKWQHWNGGVFLFNDSSKAFLDAWHSKTIAAFYDKDWRTRDQGTLVATAWEFNLQKHPLLDKKWNFIADYNNQFLEFDDDNNISDNAFQTKHKPVFIHVYHNFGNEQWDVWNWIDNQLKSAI